MRHFSLDSCLAFSLNLSYFFQCTEEREQSTGFITFSFSNGPEYHVSQVNLSLPAGTCAFNFCFNNLFSCICFRSLIPSIISDSSEFGEYKCFYLCILKYP